MSCFQVLSMMASWRKHGKRMESACKSRHTDSAAKQRIARRTGMQKAIALRPMTKSA
jgi:hypothetical protein